MMSASRSHTRILIGAGSFADAEAAIRLAERMGAILPAELGGVLVDEGLLRDLLVLPFQKVVTPGGSLVVPPSVDQIRALFESDARAFRNMLSALAQRRSVKWSFERREGDLIHGLCEAARAWDILLLGHRKLHKRSGVVVAVTDDLRRAERTTTLAHDLAHTLKTNVVSMSLSGTDDDTNPHVAIRITAENAPDLLAHLRRINASAVVIDLETSPLHSEDQLRELLEAARCPVLVLGTANASSMLTS